LNNETQVKICNNKEENYSNFISKMTKSITGYWGPNVFETNTTKPSSNSYSGGGRSIKNIVSNVSIPKPKTKIYNLKLV